MKNSSLEKFRSFEMSKEVTKTVNGSCHPNVGKCIQTALEDGNDFLVNICIEVLC